MELLRIVWRDYRWPFVAVVLLSLTSAGLGIGVIAFINQRLLGTFTDPWRILPEFLGLIALLLVITLGITVGPDHAGPPFRLPAAGAVDQANSGYRYRTR